MNLANKSMLQTSTPRFSQASIQASLARLLTQSELNIYDSYYADQVSDQPLFVKCSNDQYFQWYGLCILCCNDHEQKYFKFIKGPSYVRIAKNINLQAIQIDIFIQGMTTFLLEQYSALLKKLDPDKSSFGSFSNQFPLLAKPNDSCFTELLQTKIQVSLNNFIFIQKQLQAELESIIKESTFSEIYRKQFNKLQVNQRIVKCNCPKVPSKTFNWHGYCEGCKEGNHQLQILNQGDLVNSNKVKIIDLNELRNFITIEFKQMVHKFIVYRLQAQNLEIIEQNKGLADKLSEEQQLTENMKEQVSNLKDQTIMIKVNNNNKIQTPQQFNRVNEDAAVQILRPDIRVDTFYDVVINCESVLKLTAGQGWEILINTDIYDQKKQQNTVVVSFYGLYNKGKTFLASKLSNKVLPRGYSISTVGLSALYPADLINENSIVFLDTAGTETPICYQKEDEIITKHIKEILNENNLQDLKSHEKKRRIYELKLKDRLLTEHLLQRFILSQSNIVMIVVDQLTKEEQRLIQKIKSLYERNEIIIIHNFSKLVSNEDVQTYIVKDILESFEVQEQYRIFDETNLKGAYYVENRYDMTGQKLPDITHVVMAFHASEAGNTYNQFCYHYLRTRILAITQAKYFDIISQLITMLKTTIPEIVDVAADQLTTIQVQQQDKFITVNLNTTNLKSISFDLLGDLKVFKGGLDPKYSMIIMNKEKLILQVELCGPFYASEHDVKSNSKRIITFPNTDFSLFEWHGFRKDHNDKSQYIILRGVKSDLKSSNEKTTVLYNNRQKGEFRMIIPMNPSLCVLRDGKPNLEFKSGIIQLIYDLQLNIEEIDLF